MRRPLTATALALFLTLPALGEKVDLRGPAPKAGEVTVSTVESKMEAGNLNMTMQGQGRRGQEDAKNGDPSSQERVLESGRRIKFSNPT